MKRSKPLVASSKSRSVIVVKCWFSDSTVLEGGRETTMILPSTLLTCATTFNQIIVSQSVIYQTRYGDIDARNVSV
jgi:hypothetical protein